MKPIAIVPVVIAIVLAIAPGADAATTPNFAFEHGSANYRTAPATVPGAYQPGITPRAACPASGVPTCTYEAHEFTIAPGQENGAFAVSVTWESEDDDWDLYVYKVRGDGSVDESSPVASSAQGGTTDETAIMRSGPDAPIAAGTYRIYVDNWAVATSMDWKGYVAFSPYVASNRLPAANFAAPAGATAGSPVPLDASGSSDPDGRIVDYAWDLDGNGAFETAGGASPTLSPSLPAGRANIGLKVTDNRGGVAYATRSFTVAAPGAPATQGVAFGPRQIGFDLRRRQKRATVLRRGLAVTVACPSRCTMVATLTASSSVARRLGLRGSRVIAGAKRTLRDRGYARLRVKARRGARPGLRRSRSVSGTLRIAVTAANGTRRTLTRTVTIVR